jgi:hypothetical protein
LKGDDRPITLNNGDNIQETTFIDEDNAEEFKTIMRKKRCQRKPKEEERRDHVTTGTSTARCALKGIDLRVHLHVWRLEKGTSTKQVEEYLKSELGQEAAIVVTEMRKPRGITRLLGLVLRVA